MERKITIEDTIIYKEDYQSFMLRENQLEGLLPFRSHIRNQISLFDYDVTGKVSLRAMYEKSLMSGEDMIRFLEQFMTVVKETERHLLNMNRILLDPEYIFYEEEHYYFCYYPVAEGDIWMNFHKLTEYFVKKADYNDSLAVQVVFLLHKGTMTENYNIEKVMAGCLEEQKKLKKKAEVHIIKEETEKNITEEETRIPQTPSKQRRSWLPKRKNKWGKWDDLTDQQAP